MRSGDTVALGVIDPGSVGGAFAQDAFMLARARASRITSYIRVEGNLLSRQRNDLVSTFLQHSPSQWLLMLDTDHRFSVAMFDALIGAVHDAAVPVLGGAYFGVRPGPGLMPTPFPTFSREAADGGAYEPVVHYPTGRVIPVDALGTGCLIVHRQVLEAIRALNPEAPDYCWFQDGPHEGEWMGEDVTFCRRVRAAGFPVHVHTGVVLPHSKHVWIGQEHFEAWRSAQDFGPSPEGGRT